MTTWPHRPGPRRRAATHFAPGIAETSIEPPPMAPHLVPRRMREAWAALVVLVATFAVVAAMVVWTLARLADASIEARIVYVAIGVAGVAVLVLYGVSILAHVLPAALGMRRR